MIRLATWMYGDWRCLLGVVCINYCSTLTMHQTAWGNPCVVYSAVAAEDRRSLCVMRVSVPLHWLYQPAAAVYINDRDVIRYVHIEFEDLRSSANFYRFLLIVTIKSPSITSRTFHHLRYAAPNGYIGMSLFHVLIEPFCPRIYDDPKIDEFCDQHLCGNFFYRIVLSNSARIMNYVK